MYAFRLCFTLSPFIVSIAMAQSPPAYSVCDANLALLVAEVPSNPFWANVSFSAWQNQPDGSRKQINTPDPTRPLNAYFVARDSLGRVTVNLRGEGTFHGPDKNHTLVNGKSAYSMQYVCDPNAGTVTTIDYRDAYYGGVDPATGQDVYLPAGQAGHEWIRTQQEPRTNATFRAYHNSVAGRANLGPIVFEGISAFQYRFLKIPGKEAPMLHEEVISEDLEAMMSQTVGDQDDPTLEREVRLTQIHREEPDPRRFTAPSGVMIEVMGSNASKGVQAVPPVKTP